MNAKRTHIAQMAEKLGRHSQRATYSAVGGAVQWRAQSVRKGLPRDRRNSWVVAVKNGEPTGFSKKDWDPLLKQNTRVIHSPTDLGEWLRNHL